MKPKKIIKELEKICNSNKCDTCPFGVYFEWFDCYALECLFSVPAEPRYYKQIIKKSKNYIKNKKNKVWEELDGNKSDSN